MKISRLLILAGFAAIAMALVWQAYLISQIRGEVTELRKDLRRSLEMAIANEAGQMPDVGEVPREELELVKLRHQVRELNESLLQSRARERTANLRSAMSSFLPAQQSGAWTFRPEWQPLATLATNQYAQAMKTLTGATNDYIRFLALSQAAKMSLAVGRTEDARQFAEDLLLLDDKFSRGDSEKANGDAVHRSHIVLGTLALDEGDIEEAKRQLLAAGKSKGSPVLGSFGPNMSLAKELLEKGEQEVVLQYLDMCRTFWSSGSEKVEAWKKDIHSGRIPNFGNNLLH